MEVISIYCDCSKDAIASKINNVIKAIALDFDCIASIDYNVDKKAD